LRGRGLEVHVAAPEGCPMEHIFGVEIGGFVRRLHEQNGVTFHLGTTVAAIEDKAVRPATGEVVSADLVIVGIGVRPAVALAEAAGLATDRGVLVNEYLETSRWHRARSRPHSRCSSSSTRSCCWPSPGMPDASSCAVRRSQSRPNNRTWRAPARMRRRAPIRQSETMHPDLPFWFGVAMTFGVAMYMIADGFDLGIGILFLLAPSEDDRDIMMNSIAPIWDGNETWLVFGGTVLIGAFPLAYATILPALYLPLILLSFTKVGLQNASASGAASVAPAKCDSLPV
jgi:hypothetical protein